MISLKQVQQLDIRVKRAVTAVKNLSVENSTLKIRIIELEAKLEELNNEASIRKASEQELEVGLQGVLDVLSEVDSETSDIEPEQPKDNYVIETVSLDDEDQGDIEPDTKENSIEVIGEKVAEDIPAEEPRTDTEDSLYESESALFVVESVDEATEAQVAEPVTESLVEESIPLDQELESTATTEPVEVTVPGPGGTAAVAEEVPGVGQVVEFTVPEDAESEMTILADTDTETTKTEQPEEEIILEKDGEENIVVEDEFQSEFDIF